MIHRLMEMLRSRDDDIEQQGIELACTIGGEEAANTAREWIEAQRAIERTEEDIAWDDVGDDPKAMWAVEDALEGYRRDEVAARVVLVAL